MPRARAMPILPLGSGRGVFDAEELEPLALPGADVAREEVARCGWRPERGAGERHVRLPQRATALLVIAALARGDDVLPDVLAAAVAGDHVVEGEVVAALAAVLAGVVVADEDFLAGHLQHGPWSLDVVGETDHGRRDDRSSLARDDVSVLLDDNGLLLIQQDHRAPHVAYVQRLVVQGEHED